MGDATSEGVGETTERLDTSIDPAWFVSGIGVLLFALASWHQLEFGLGLSVGSVGPVPALDVALSAFEFVLMVGFSLGLVYAGVWLARSPFTAEQRWWVLLWFIMGLAGVTAVVMLVQFNQLLDGRGVSRQTVIEELLLAAGGGGVVGLFTGLTNAELRRKRAEVAAQRDAFESLNAFLRHNVLNGMQYITGYADVLTDRVDGDDDRRYLETIKTQGEQIVFVVQNARTLTKAIVPEGTQTTVNLSTTLAREVDTLARKYDHATVTRTIQEEVYVSAGEMLPAVVRTLLCALVQRSTEETPSVDVTLETTGGRGLVTISGSAIPYPDGGQVATDDRARGRESTFIRDELGLGLVRQVLRQYGGDVWFDHAEADGQTVKLELPLARSP